LDKIYPIINRSRQIYNVLGFFYTKTTMNLFTFLLPIKKPYLSVHNKTRYVVNLIINNSLVHLYFCSWCYWNDENVNLIKDNRLYGIYCMSFVHIKMLLFCVVCFTKFDTQACYHCTFHIRVCQKVISLNLSLDLHFLACVLFILPEPACRKLKKLFGLLPRLYLLHK